MKTVNFSGRKLSMREFIMKKNPLLQEDVCYDSFTALYSPDNEDVWRTIGEYGLLVVNIDSETGTACSFYTLLYFSF